MANILALSTGILAILNLLASQMSASLSHASERYALTGIGGGRDTLYSYQGIIYAFDGGLSDAGRIARIWTKTAHFTYQTDLPEQPATKIEVFGTGLEVEFGWQWSMDDVRFAAMGGLVWRDHTMLPIDPGSDLERDHFGFTGAFDGEWRVAKGFGVMANANYAFGLKQHWLQFKPYLALKDGLRVGPEIAFAGAKNYRYARLGFYASGYQLPIDKLPWTFSGRAYLGSELGLQVDLDEHRAIPYAGLNVGYLF